MGISRGTLIIRLCGSVFFVPRCYYTLSCLSVQGLERLIQANRKSLRGCERGKSTTSCLATLDFRAYKLALPPAHRLGPGFRLSHDR